LDLCIICEVVHNGTLAIDDIEDNSTLRRGKPCLHKIYGLDVAINTGNTMYFLPLLVFKEMKSVLPNEVLIKCYELYAEEMVKIHLGQGIDIWWHNSKKEKDPTVGQYLQMCALKTGALARLSALLGAIASGASEEVARSLGKFAECIGVAFQIQDDLLSVIGEEYSAGKGIMGEDIVEGKRTLMVIHSLEKSAPEKANRLRVILDAHTSNTEEIKEAISILKESGSIEYAKTIAREIVSNSWKEVEPILKDGKAKKLLWSFAEYLITRNM